MTAESPSRSGGVQDEEQEARDPLPIRDVGREQLARGMGAIGGSLMTVIRKPAAVKASVIACSGRLQKRSIALWPPAVHSTV